MLIPPVSLSLIRGLGALVAQKFAAQGSNVAINYFSSADAAEKIASDIRAQYNVKAITIKGVRPPSGLVCASCYSDGMANTSSRDVGCESQGRL